MTAYQGLQDTAYLTVVGTAMTDVIMGLDKRGKSFARVQVKVDVAKETYWISTIAFDAAVVDGMRHIRKDTRLDIGGRLQIRTWTGNDNKERTSVGIVVGALTLLDDAPPPATRAPQEDPYVGERLFGMAGANP